MAKIGILTFSFTKDNYGQVLQYLATQEYLHKAGHDAVLVEPTGWRERQKNIIERKAISFIRIIKRHILHSRNQTLFSIPFSSDDLLTDKEEQKKVIFQQWSRITERNEQKHPRHFEEFRTLYFNRQKGTYNDILASGYKGFCIGSDQTWSDAGYHMMLGWVPKKYKKFSIAPSVGHRKYTYDEIKSLKRLIRRFDFVTVREDNGIELCNLCGFKNAIKILDPTFLLDAKDYDKFAKSTNNRHPYIFIYLLGGEISISIKEILDFCTINGYDVKYVESQGREEQVPKEYATVEDWLGLLKGASYVITNSYHGMAMSIIFKIPFIIFPLVGLMADMNSRINDLTNRMGLASRVFDCNMNILFEPIDWQKAETVIHNNRETVASLLQKINL